VIAGGMNIFPLGKILAFDAPIGQTLPFQQ
jgi:hypothetical protein